MKCTHSLLNPPTLQGPTSRTVFSPSDCSASFGIYSNICSHKERYRTQTWYRHGDSYDSQERQIEHEHAMTPYLEAQDKETWWGSFFSSNQKGERKQENMDKHLEFLDRRYNRLHSDEVSPKSDNGRINSAWNWLFEDSGETEPSPRSFSQMQDDALYILGVAELASEKLLHKHRLKMQNQVALETHPNPSLQQIIAESDFKSPKQSFDKHVLNKLQVFRIVLKEVLKIECTNLFRKFSLGWGGAIKTLRKPKNCLLSLMGVVSVSFVASLMNIVMQF